MRIQEVTVGSQTQSAPIPMDRTIAPFAVGVGCVVNSGTLTYSVEHTFDDILGGATATWFPHSTIAAKTTNTDGNYAFPVTAIRLNVTAWTSGSVTMKLLQGSNK